MAEDDRQTVGDAPKPSEEAVPACDGPAVVPKPLDAIPVEPVSVEPVSVEPVLVEAVAVGAVEGMATVAAVPRGAADRWIMPAELAEIYGDALPPGGLSPSGFAAVVYRPPPPRIWTVFVAVGLSIPFGIAVSVVIGVFWLIALHGPEVFADQSGIPKKLEAITMTPAGLVGMVIPGQAVFLAVALFGALLSPQPWRERLRLVRGRLPLWTWLPLALATPSIAHLTSLALSQVFDSPSEHLQQMEDLFRRFDAQWLPVLFLLVAGLPGIAEELLFRGYVQSRLARAWPPVFAIVLSGLMFGAAHLDPMHSIAVVPLGVWLGLIAYRCDSSWPAVIGHVVNNAFALVMMRFFQTETTEKGQSVPLLALAMLLSSFLALVVSVALIAKKDRVAC